MRTKEDNRAADLMSWICNHAPYRRELLWLDAMGKGDSASAEDLLSVDDQIVARLRRRYRLARDEVESEAARRAHFHELWHLHYAYLELRFEDEVGR